MAMEKLYQVAFLSVGRGVGFAGLAILILMLGLSFEPVLALKSGGILLLILLAALLLKAYFLPFTNYRDTETWLLLDKADRPDERYAGVVMVTVLREAYLKFAHWTAGLASAVWIAAIALAWLGVGADIGMEPRNPHAGFACVAWVIRRPAAERP